MDTVLISEALVSRYNLQHFNEFYTPNSEEWIDSIISVTEFKNLKWSDALEVIGSLLENGAKIWFDSLGQYELSELPEFREAFLARFMTGKRINMHMYNCLKQAKMKV